ncbi:hypothetical protein LguiA_029460 [Lonicera macranthoides]
MVGLLIDIPWNFFWEKYDNDHSFTIRSLDKTRKIKCARTARRAFEFGRTYVVRPEGKHHATIVRSKGQWFKSISQEALLSQAQALTFIVIDQRLGSNMGFAKGPTGLSKYLISSPTREVFFGGKAMRFSNKKGNEERKGKSKGFHALITQL